MALSGTELNEGRVPVKFEMIPLAAVDAAIPVPLSAQPAPAAKTLADTGGGASASAAEAPPVPGDAKAAHPDEDQAIVITGIKRAAGDILGGVSVVDTQALQRTARPSIGETLASQPGVTAS